MRDGLMTCFEPVSLKVEQHYQLDHVLQLCLTAYMTQYIYMAMTIHQRVKFTLCACVSYRASDIISLT